jgi:hypothetical protein
MQMYMKSCLPPLIAREIQIKTTMKLHLIGKRRGWGKKDVSKNVENLEHYMLLVGM